MVRELIKEIGGTVLLLFGGMVFFTFVLILVEWKFPQDAQVFQVISGLLAGFGGAFFGLMTGKAKQPPPAQPGPTATQTPAP